MALKLNISFPIFAPSIPPVQSPYPKPNPGPNPLHHRGPFEVRFSRWNNANAEQFNQRRRAQEEIEADIRRHRRFDAVTRIAQTHDSAAGAVEVPESATFKSRGTPSLPSAPSIPGKKSKYSKPEREPKTKNKPQVPNTPPQLETKPSVKVSEDGVSFVIDGAPFEFKYSYTETPKVKPLKLREPYAPFGPTTMGRPWTGRPPLPPSKKTLKEFDSFELPPPGKKGVKPVQKPGPFLPGSVPKYVYRREEILGEPLSREEVRELVSGCIKSTRQLNMGRDGLTHNMLDNIHAHWKRRRVCKIKCKGVCTVDMDNVCQQLEEKTGGKVIHRKGGVLFLFRGRNYNYKTRPHFPLMLWKPVTPVYPRLLQRVPEGLTLGEATEMRRKGRELIPICKLAKNGVYGDLVKNVREAFEVCELVRINCQGIKGSDYRKIGAKLKDLVPCVLISFENEHILIWRGGNWKSSLPSVDDKNKIMDETEVVAAAYVAAPSENHEASLVLDSQMPEIEDGNYHTHTGIMDVQVNRTGNDQISIEDSDRLTEIDSVSIPLKKDDITLEATSSSSNVSQATEDANGGRSFMESAKCIDGSESAYENSLGDHQPLDPPESSDDVSEPTDQQCTEKVLILMKQAVENGSALVLDDSDFDADSVFKKAAALAKSAPPGPLFQHRPRKLRVKKKSEEEQESEDLDTEVKNEDVAVSEKVGRHKQRSEKRKGYLGGDYRDVLPQGSLRVDELAKLLA